MKRSPIGVRELDKAIGGGLPEGSLILVAGKPGSGKTVLGTIFLSEGMTRYGERGIYASFAEGRETLTRNICEHLGVAKKDCPLSWSDKIRVIDFITVREKAVEDILKVIVEEIAALKAKRLVIDSFSALSLALENKTDVRFVLQTVLGKIVKNLGCTTLLIMESDRVEGVEGYVADGILNLTQDYVEDRLLRLVKILKLRGTRLGEQDFPYTLERGFTVFPKYSSILGKMTKLKPISDSKDYFSTGIEDLDALLGGGYARGSHVLIEYGENVPTPTFTIIITAANFLQNGNIMMGVPSMGLDADELADIYSMIVDKDVFENKRLKMAYYGNGLLESYMLKCQGKKEDLDKWRGFYEKLKAERKETVLMAVGFDVVENFYGSEPTLMGIVGEMIAKIKSNRDLRIDLVKQSASYLRKMADSSDIHLKVIEKAGRLFLYGKKPRTILHNLELTFTKGYPSINLTPIV